MTQWGKVSQLERREVTAEWELQEIDETGMKRPGRAAATWSDDKP